MNTTFETHYWIRENDNPWKNVTRDDFITAQHSLGIKSKLEDCLTTSTFRSDSTTLRVTRGKIVKNQHLDEPEFIQIAHGLGLIEET